MDYKGLVEELRMVASWDGVCYDCNQCVKAADAIEALLAELEEYRGTRKTQLDSPLTIDELRGMDGDPVWVILKQNGATEVLGWALVEVELEDVAATNFRLNFDTYGEDGWIAYRWKRRGRQDS